jgi:hypothetical protein
LVCKKCSDLNLVEEQTKRIYIYGIRKCLISKEVTKLDKLEFLEINARKILFEEEEFQFSKLKELILYNNTKNGIPLWVSSIPNLKMLSVSLKDESTPDNGIDKLKSLDSLIISYEVLGELPSYLPNLKHLKSLIIDCRQCESITELPKGFHELAKLEELILPIELNEENLVVLSKLKSLKFLEVKSIDRNLNAKMILNKLENLEAIYTLDHDSKKVLFPIRKEITILPYHKWSSRFD